MLRSLTISLAIVCLAATVADARPRHPHYRHHYSRAGACDGIHRCRCGSTQTAHFGFPRFVNGHNLWRAVEWIHAFPRTSIHVGAVGYVRHGGPSGHVFRITSYSGGSTAIVSDDKGTYERRITNAIFVDPNGNTTTYSAKPHRYKQYASSSNYDRAVGAF